MDPSAKRDVSIIPVKTQQDLNATTSLFKAYAHSLGIDLTFQNFTTELSTLPGKYSPSHNGALFLARLTSTGQAVGCVGLRAMTQPGTCEIKRLYVEPAGRGLGVGRKLAEVVILAARKLGFRAVLLDTLPQMVQARGLYRSLGFAEVEAYYETPVERTVFLRLDLTSEKQGE